MAAAGTAFSETGAACGCSGAVASGALGTNGASSGDVGDPTGPVVVVTTGVLAPVSGLSVVLGVELEVLVVLDVPVEVGFVVCDVVV